MVSRVAGGKITAIRVKFCSQLLQGNSIKTVDLLYIYVLYVRVKLDPVGGK